MAVYKATCQSCGEANIFLVDGHIGLLRLDCCRCSKPVLSVVEYITYGVLGIVGIDPTYQDKGSIHANVN